MIKDRDILEKNLSEVIIKNMNKRKFLNSINQRLNKYNIPYGTFNDITNNLENSLPNQDLHILCLLSNEIFEETKDITIDPNDYFDEKEIKKSIKFIEDSQEGNISMPYTFMKVVKVDDNDYLTKISGETIIALLRSKLLNYNFEAQRSPMYRKNSIIEEPYTNNKSVKDISEYISNDNYLPDTLTFNIYSEEFEPFAYNEKEMTLTVNSGIVIDILDGFHRIKGLERSYALGGNIKVNFNLAIKSYDEETAKRYFARISKINPVSKARIAELEADRSADKIAKLLQRSDVLNGKIASTEKIVMIGSHLSTVQIIADAIDSCYPNQNFVESKKTFRYLEEYFNYFMSYFSQRFEKSESLYSHKRDDYFTHPLMFVVFIWIAKKMEENNVDLEKINLVISNINFNDDRIKDIIIKKGLSNKKNVRTLLKYCEDNILVR